MKNYPDLSLSTFLILTFLGAVQTNAAKATNYCYLVNGMGARSY